MVNDQDLTELKRISTNAHAEDKACVNRIIMGISNFKTTIRAMKTELEALRKDNEQLKSLLTPAKPNKG